MKHTTMIQVLRRSSLLGGGLEGRKTLPPLPHHYINVSHLHLTTPRETRNICKSWFGRTKSWSTIEGCRRHGPRRLRTRKGTKKRHVVELRVIIGKRPLIQNGKRYDVLVKSEEIGERL